MKYNKICRWLAAALCLGLLSSAAGVSAFANDTEASADTVMPSGMTVGAMRESLESMAADEDHQDYASAGLAVFQGDTVLYTGHFGRINIADNLPADENTVYEWGSISKTLVWVSVMQLWEQGKLDLEADIRQYLPDGFFRHLSYDDPITMLNLMNHTAGWQETTRKIFVKDGETVPSLKDALQDCEPAQVHRPGEVTAYSNYGAAVAGYVVECVSGTDYCGYVRQHILEPLGMTQTAVNPEHTDNAWVRTQREKEHAYQNVSLMLSSYQIDLGTKLEPVTIYPAGSVTGTIGDLMRYAQALVSDDAPLFENPETQKTMLTGSYFYSGTDIPTCCHGFWTDERAVRVFGHSGATTFGQANMLFDPVTKFGYVAACNEPAGNWIFDGSTDMVFGTLQPDSCGTPTDASAPDLSSHFLISRSVFRGVPTVVTYLGGAASLQLSDNDKVSMLSSGVMQLSNDHAAVIAGVKHFPDGGWSLETPSMELIYDGSYFLKLTLLVLYCMAAIAGYYALRIRFKLRAAGSGQHFRGEAVISAGFAAQLISALSALVMSTSYYLNSGGISAGLSTATGIVQILCAAVCAVSAVCTLIAAFAKNTRKMQKILLCVSAAGNLVTVAAILFFRMFQFWI